jgi:hypothetical protein
MTFKSEFDLSLAIKLLDAPFTNDLGQLQEVTGGAPLAVVSVAINQISSELGGLCHQQVQLALGQLIELLKLNRAIQ